MVAEVEEEEEVVVVVEVSNRNNHTPFKFTVIVIAALVDLWEGYGEPTCRRNQHRFLMRPLITTKL